MTSDLFHHLTDTTHGERYEDYRKRVSMLFPLPRGRKL
jgi:protein-S-isoprenylcysteine O-methyltransferase Ste14